jgi:hypothetical protein
LRAQGQSSEEHERKAQGKESSFHDHAVLESKIVVLPKRCAAPATQNLDLPRRPRPG